MVKGQMVGTHVCAQCRYQGSLADAQAGVSTARAPCRQYGTLSQDVQSTTSKEAVGSSGSPRGLRKSPSRICGVDAGMRTWPRRATASKAARVVLPADTAKCGKRVAPPCRRALTLPGCSAASLYACARKLNDPYGVATAHGGPGSSTGSVPETRSQPGTAGRQPSASRRRGAGGGGRRPAAR